MTNTKPGAALCVLALGMLCTANTRAAGAWSDTYRTLVVTGKTDEQLLPVASEIARNGELRDRELCDVVAEKLARMREAKAATRASAAQFLNILTHCPDAGRYFAVVKAMRGYLSPSAEPIFAKYNQSFHKPVPGAFVRGAIDLDAIEREYVNAALAAQPTAAQVEVLANLPTNATLDEMFASAGRPAAIVAREVKVEAQITVDVRQVWFYYRGIGRVIYDFQRDSGWHQHLVVLDPMAFEPQMPYRARSVELKLPDDASVAIIQLLTGTPSAIKASAQKVYRMDVAPPAYLDAAAEMLLRHHAEIANTGANDAYAWLCNVLADRGGLRYQGVLTTVARATQDEKLRRFAKQPVNRSDTGVSGRYVAGSVSLEQLLKQYPTLYPGFNVTRGLL